MPKEKVLIVDDEIDVLDLCKRILESQGYQVTSAHNGHEAIDIARHEHFDLLLTDIKMPGIEGLDIAQALKASDPGIICVTMTGFSTMDMAINALKLGIDEFILKPFTPKELSLAISKAMEKERLRKENFRLRSLIPLFELNKILMGTVEVDNVLNNLIEIARKETKAYFAGLYIMEKGEITSQFRLAEGNNLTDSQKEVSDKLADLVFYNGQLLALNLGEVEGDQTELVKRLEATSVMAAPLKSQNGSLGVLILANHDALFAPSDSEFLSVLCGQASIALENARLFAEIQEAYQKLQMLDHMKSEFINIAAHELRTPLAILMGYASVLEEEIQPHHKEYIANITRNAMRLRSLIDDMLNLQHLESGIASLSHEKLHLLQVVQGIAKDVALLAEEKRLEIVVDIPSEFPALVIDRQKLDLILVNLIQNAVKFTPAGGKITFQTWVEEGKALVSINNTGITIPPKDLDRIFERFYQVESSLTREHGGAGLGLAIVRGMVHVCGGEISVRSEEPEGTTFIFSLPLDNSHLEPRRLKL
jgi:signal transduction histidine kinase/DNA-binding response OmpR family regulator